MPQVKRKTATGKYTYADYCSWPDEESWELIDGVFYNMTAAPLRQHADISNALEDLFRSFFREKPCRMYHAPFEVRLPKGNEKDEDISTVVQPDIIVVCDESKLDDKGCRGAPDFVIEILSPSTSSKDHITKKRLYEKHGVKEYWLVSPSDRIVTRYRRESSHGFGHAHIFVDTDVILIDLFPGLEIDLQKVFPPLPKVVRNPSTEYL